MTPAPALAAALLAAVLCAGPAPAGTPPEARPEPTSESPRLAVSALAYAAMVRAHRTADCPALLAGAAQLDAAPDKERQSPMAQGIAWSWAAGCAIRLGDMAQARMRTDGLFAYGDQPDADLGLFGFAVADVAREAAQRSGTAAFALEIDDRFGAWARIGDHGRAVGGYQVTADLERPAALALLGRDAAARTALAAEGMSPRKHLFFLIDRRFAALWPGPAAAAGDIEARARRAYHADDMADRAGVVTVAAGLLALGREDEVLAMTGVWARGVQRLGYPVPDAPTRRYMEALAWLARGDLDQALAVAMTGPGHDAPDDPRLVSAVALALVAADRPADAARVLDHWDAALGGRQPLPQIRVCVDARLGKAAGPIPADIYAYSHDTLAALLCVGDEDGAAAYIVRRLADPAQRVWMLGELQHYRERPPLGVFDRQMRVRRAHLLARPDVAAAIAREGRILDLSLYGPPYE